MRKLLTFKFFERPAPKVAADLVGKYLVREINGLQKAYIITETEAYEGTEDLASHASKGHTQRTETMFGRAGIFYVYLVYGMYHMLNIVTGKENHPGAVLIRSVESISGPGRLTKRLIIGREFNALPAIPKTGLWFAPTPPKGVGVPIESVGKEKFKILKTPRIGVSYAGPIWSKKLWRFVYDKKFN